MDNVTIDIVEVPDVVIVGVVEIPDLVSVAISELGSKGESGANAVVLNETPGGAINGSNATFTTSLPFSAVVVKLNGMVQKIIDDYQVIGTQQIVFLVSPGVNDKISVDYIKQT